MRILEFAAVLTLRLFTRILPFRLIASAGAAAGWFFEILGIRKSLALENISLSNLALSNKEAQRVVSGAYRNFGITFFQLLTLDRTKPHPGGDYKLFIPENLRSKISNGSIFLSAHFGNWEMMGKILCDNGIPLAVVAHRQSNERVDMLIRKIRENSGMVVIYDDEPLKLTALIEKGFNLALLADQDFGNNTDPVHFFGRPCFAAKGPGFLAEKFNLPVFFCYSVRQKSNKVHCFIEHIPDRNRLMTTYHQKLENIVRNHPEQWFWFHRRWKLHA